LNVRLESIVGQFETDLIVTLASAAMGHELTAFTSSNFNLFTSNDRTGQRSTQKINRFVNGVGLNGREDEFLDEFFFQVL
jgi:hypothetical protein